MLHRRVFLHLFACAVAQLAFQRAVRAQSYPDRPITLVVPFPAGGPTDVIARIFAERLRLALGQAVIVENVAGAGATIGVARVIRAAPDGYTLSAGNSTSHVGGPAIYPFTYDILNDFEPVALLSISPTLLVARKDFPADTVRDLIAWLKANPGKATGGTSGAGSSVCGLPPKARSRFPICATVRSRHWRCSHPPAGRRRPTCRPLTRLVCRDFTCRCGTAYGRPREPRTTSSSSS